MATTLRGIQTLRRRQQLASDHRAGQWARTKARLAQRRYARSQWKRLTPVAAIGIVLTYAAAQVVTSSYLRGLVLGAGVVGILASLATWVMQVTSTAPILMGDLGEQWTAGELRSLTRKGWRVVNRLQLRPRRDIDHVLVGPGGAYAVETKWSAEPWRLEPAEPRVLSAANQARLNARDLRLWSAFQREVGSIEPVVVLWGPVAAASPDTATVGGTTVVAGRALDTWRKSLPEAHLGPCQVDAAWGLLDKQAQTRDAEVSTPLPPSLTELAAGAIGVVITACVGAYLAAGLLSVTNSPIWTGLGCLVLALGGIPALRWPPSRIYAIAWEAGLCGVAALGAIAIVT